MSWSFEICQIGVPEPGVYFFTVKSYAGVPSEEVASTSEPR
ncbi:hypothetical protein [Leifsonia xyli]|nr:hypothetical protein [Leifsonia xyli]